MRRWITAVLSSTLLMLGSASATLAQTTPLVAGGLTALPPELTGLDQLRNGDFETLNGGLPANWTAGSGWGVDQLIRHGGTYSYRATGNFATSTQTLQVRRGIYTLSGWIKTSSVGSGSTNGVRLQFDFRPYVSEWKTTDVISGTRDWTLYEIKNVVVTQDATVTMKLENYNNTGGTVWFDDVRLVEQLPQAVDVFMLYPNLRGMLFDDQPQTMRFDLTVTPPGGDFGRYQVAGTLNDEVTGQVLLTRTYPAQASFVAEMDGSLMQAGRPYLATFSLVDLSNDAVVSTYPAYRVSKASGAVKQAMNIAFDDKNRVLVHGVPRFVLGVYDSGSGYSAQDSFWENQLWSPTGERRMDGMRINFYLNYWYGESPIDAMNALMTNLQRRGVMYLQTGNCFDRYAAGSNFFINNSDSYVQTLGAHPGSGGYYTIDECLSSLIPGAFAQYDRLRRLDPDSITFMANFGNADIALWRDSVDILSADPYPMYGAEPSGGYNHRQVADWTANTRNAVKDARPIMTVLQFFKFTSQGRWPTLQEMRNHAYMAIVEGARGLWWWSLGDNALLAVCSGWCAEKTTYMNNLKSVVNELAGLEPALVADDSTGSLTGNSNPTAIRTKVKVVDGRGYVFAYNYTASQASATFTWNTAPGTVTVNGENRTLAASGGSFTDSFGAYQAHVYVIGNPGSGGGGGGDGGTTSPTLTFVNPAAGATVSGTTTVTLAASGGSGTGYNYALAVDGSNVYTGTNPTFSWNTTTAADGSRALTATVTDSAGASGTAARTVTVSNAVATTPTVTFVSPAAGATVSGTTTVTLSASGGSGSGYTYTVAVDGTSVYTGTTPTFNWNTTAVADGSRTLTATVTNSAGASGPATRTVTVSNTSTPPPTGTLRVYVTQPTSGTVASGTNWAVIWLEGAAAGSNAYTLSIGSQTVGSTTTSSTGPVSIPWNTAAVTDGTQVLTATARDASDNTGSGSVTVTVRNDSVPSPLALAFSSPAAGATVSGTTTVALTASGGSGSGYTYTLAVDGGAAVALTGASYTWNTTAVSNGSHTLTATVRDSAGATATATRTVTVANGGSTTPLAVAFTAPAAGATVSGTVTVTAAASGGTGYTYRHAVDGTDVATTASYSWNTLTVANGNRTLSVTVTDAAGRTATATRTVTVSNPVLRVVFTTPAAGATVKGTVTVTASASGGSGYAYRHAVDGTDVATTRSYSWNTLTVANGSRTLSVTVTDAAGRAATATRTVTVSNPALAVRYTTPAEGATVKGTVTVTASANGGSGYAYRHAVDGTDVATTRSYSWNTLTAADGSHTLSVTVTDGGGRTATATRTVTVSNPPLTVAYARPAAETTVKGTVRVIASPRGGRDYTYRHFVDGTQVATAASFSWKTSTVANGTHALSVTVTDAAGRTATASRTVTVANAAGALQVAITRPTSGTTVSGTHWAVVWVTGASAGSNTYTLTAGGKTVGSTTTSSIGPASIPWDTTAVADGTQTLTATVRDAAGNTGTRSVTVTVNNDAAATGTLKVSITQPTDGASVSDTAWVVVWVEGATGSANTVTLNVDGQVVTTPQTVAGSGPVSLPWLTSLSGNGSHTVTATVRDQTGNTGGRTITLTVIN